MAHPDVVPFDVRVGILRGPTSRAFRDVGAQSEHDLICHPEKRRPSQSEGRPLPTKDLCTLYTPKGPRTASYYYCLTVVSYHVSILETACQLMIASFRDKETEGLWRSGKSRRLPADLERRAFKKLAILNAAVHLDNLKVPPGNHLGALRGNRAGQHSIRINDQYRVRFLWRDGNAFDVEIVDYH